MRLCSGKPQIDDQVLDRQAVDSVFDMLEPRKKLVALLGRNTFRLVREIRGNVAIGEDDLSRGQSRFDFAFCLEAVPGINQCGQVRVNCFERTEITVKIAAREFAKSGFVARESDALDREIARFKAMRKQIKLRTL